MKRIAKIFTAIALLLSIPLTAEIKIGGYTLASPSAPMLRASIGTRGYTAGFLSRIGGVAFDQKALPAAGFEPRSVVLKYVAANADGQRVVAVINGQPIRVNLYDWQLGPIVRFADSNDTAVFTLFGQLDDPGQQAEVLNNDGRVVNYHAAFSNTLMGLRMLQLDTLLAGSANDDLAVDLPKDGDRYILGNGERLPDVTRNRAGLAYYQAALKAGIGDDQARFRSYVIGDAGREIRFHAEQGALRISGEPGYYFWKYNGDDPAVEALIRSRAKTRIRLAKVAAMQQESSTFAEQAWLISQLGESFGRPFSAQEKGLLRGMSVAKLNVMLENRRVRQTLEQAEYKKVIHLLEMSDFVNSRTELVRKINPNVWSAATTVMRYAAFFRYCRGNAPTAWEAFSQRVSGIAAQPAVTTPTVLQLASAGR